MLDFNYDEFLKKRYSWAIHAVFVWLLSLTLASVFYGLVIFSQFLSPSEWLKVFIYSTGYLSQMFVEGIKYFNFTTLWAFLFIPSICYLAFLTMFANCFSRYYRYAFLCLLVLVTIAFTFSLSHHYAMI